MKIAHLLGLVGFGVLLSACSDETPSGPTNVTAEDEVLFTVNTASVDSRTMYGDENADGTAQGLYWGNYNDWVADSIKIFSPHTRFGSANYLITPNTANSNTAADVTRLGEYGLQWGSNPDNLENFEFYAFYPASRCDDDVTYSDKTATGSAVVDAWIRPGQSPVSFTESTSGGTTTYLGNPDMRACLMTAHTSAPYGAEAVGFKFRPLATVLDVTIQGPQVGNTQAEDIYTVSLEHINGEAIVGNFKVDLSNNKMVENSITNGESQISMQPRITVYDKTTHQPTSTTMVQLGRNKVMKVRFFLIPRNDIQISDLRLTVTTKAKRYIKTLTPADVASTATTLAASSIRKVKLPYMDAASGSDFNVNFWLSELDPDIYVTELSIPGAYNAASYKLSGSSKFQSVEAQQQFQAGVRAFGFSIFDNYEFNDTSNPTAVKSKTLCYGNAGTRTSLNANATNNFKIGTVSDLFTKLNSWLDEEKSKWNKQYSDKDFNDFVVLCLAPYRYYNTYDTHKDFFQQCYEISNSLKAEINKYNESNPGAIFTGPITPNTTVADVAGKIIIHYNASSAVIYDPKTNITGAAQAGETAANVNGVDALFSFWNAPENDEYKSRPQLVNMDWGAPPAVTTPQESISAASLGWLFYEFNGVDTNSEPGNNFVTYEQFKSGITNYGIASYNNYVKKEHNIWGFLQIGGRYVTDGVTGVDQCTKMANEFNTFTYNYIASGQRVAAPWGIIMMNYADATSPEAVAAKSPELIRAIIANNSLFPLQRKSDNPTPTSVKNGGPIVKVGEWDQNK